MKFAATFLCLLALSACRAGPFDASAHWRPYQRPVPLLIDAEACKLCLERIDYAMDYWVEFAPYLVPTYGGAEARGAHDGTISLTCDPFAKEPRALGHTEWVHFFQTMRSAQIVIWDCNDQTVAHEIGHALGLRHHGSQSSDRWLMGNGGEGWELDQAERAWVR
jgi:hypothetical protein